MDERKIEELLMEAFVQETISQLLYRHRQGSSLTRLQRVLDGAAPREAPKGKKLFGGKNHGRKKN